MYSNVNDIKEDGHFEACCDACRKADQIQLGHFACVLNARVSHAFAAGERAFYAYGSWWIQDFRSRRTVRRRARRRYRGSRQRDLLRAQWQDRGPLRAPLLACGLVAVLAAFFMVFSGACGPVNGQYDDTHIHRTATVPDRYVKNVLCLEMGIHLDYSVTCDNGNTCTVLCYSPRQWADGDSPREVFTTWTCTGRNNCSRHR